MSRRLVLSLAAAMAAVVAMAIPSGSARADDPDVCGQTVVAACLDDVDEAAAAVAAVPQAALPDATCRLPLEFVAWTASDWVRLAKGLVADAAHCAEYWVSIPPLAANKTGLRVLQDDAVRVLGANVHPVAEMTLGSGSGWAKWVASGNGTWFQAGVEFRRRMAVAGYDVTRGETWLLNELDRSTMRDADRTEPDQKDPSGNLLPAYRRAAMQDVLLGLYYGDVGMPHAPGVVEYGIHFRHQNIPDVAGYKAELEGFLADGAFWSEIGPAIRWLAVETYPDVRYWGVDGSSRSERRDHLAEYVFHMLDLVRNGPPETDAARQVLERTYTPFLNSGWRARGGDQFDFVTGHGNTIVDIATMRRFVSEQVLAVRHYAGAHVNGAPAGRIGFSFEPVNRQRADQAVGDPWTPTFTAEVDELVGHIAASVRASYAQGGSSPVGACGDANEWCNGAVVPGGAFTDSWAMFGSW